MFSASVSDLFHSVVQIEDLSRAWPTILELLKFCSKLAVYILPLRCLLFLNICTEGSGRGRSRKVCGGFAARVCDDLFLYYSITNSPIARARTIFTWSGFRDALLMSR